MGTHPQTAPAESSASCVARQPILKADEEVIGYELSFEHNPLGQHRDIESEAGVIIETLNVIGLNVLCNGRRAFIDCTLQMLLMDSFALLTPRRGF
jgi:c-di-GMP-related signal transduction protein